MVSSIRVLTTSPMETIPQNSIALDDGHVPETAARHRLHDFGDGVGFFAHRDVGCHPCTDSQCKGGRTLFRDRAYDIALRNDARRPPSPRTISAPMRCRVSTEAAS